MIKLMPNKNTSKIALYFLTITTLIFALLYGIEAGGIDYTYSAEINATGEPGANDSISVEAQIRQIAEEEDFQWPDYLIRLSVCESNLNPNAIGDSGHSRGLFQIHDLYWPSVSDEEAFDIEYATKWTMDMINAGYQHYWSCDKLVKNI